MYKTKYSPHLVNTIPHSMTKWQYVKHIRKLWLTLILSIIGAMALGNGIVYAISLYVPQEPSIVKPMIAMTVIMGGFLILFSIVSLLLGKLPPTDADIEAENRRTYEELKTLYEG